ALSIFAKDGQATNVTVSEIAQSGGFNSCYVEFDKAGFHYTVRVNTDCHMIVYGMATDGNTEVDFDDDGTVLNGLTSDGDFLTKSQVLARM
ncbi:MAG: hypothetical protein Q4B54_02305, partial [Coriobacteriales bacterium]|nr:hypothetical protein [Coriobacteriales bacterium]